MDEVLLVGGPKDGEKVAMPGLTFAFLECDGELPPIRAYADFDPAATVELRKGVYARDVYDRRRALWQGWQ